MAGWSSFIESSSSFIDVKIEYFDECEERLKKLFDKALLVFLEEEGKIRPLPVVLGNGKKVDLFKLFVLVREREGFDTVSRKGLWELVAEKLGLDCSVSPSLKLIYSKYLDSMEKWAVEKSRIVNWDNQDSKKKGCYGGLLHELGNGFKGLLENGKCQKRKHIEESGSELYRKRFRESSHDGVEEMSCFVLSDESVECSEEEGLDLSSVKQGDLTEMLKWLSSVARCPHDLSIANSSNECWFQVIRMKNALMVQRDNSPLLGHQTMHPSMYEDDRKSTGRLRYSIRRSSLSKHRSSSCYNGTSGATDLQVYSNGITEPEIPRRYVAVGRNFQARVDEWTESSLGSDTKWLGTRIWPLQNEESLDMVGKGRPDCCSCDVFLSGSVECIRFHIAEKRMELKRDLGDVFFHWRFNQMGEEVCLRWTEREEKKFKDMMISDPQSFWENAKRCFGLKKREQLVSYYFNVFLINRRRYQNRTSPKHIDSDDDEAFGCVGNSFGRDAVTLFGSDIMICSQNRQCDDLE